jgi:hypothetical protein
MPETLEVLESVNTADIAILFNSYLEFQTSDWGDSSWDELIISASLIWKKSPLFMDILAGSYIWSIRRIPSNFINNV